MPPAAIVSLAVLGLTQGDKQCSQGNQLLIISGQEPPSEGPHPSQTEPEVSTRASGGGELGAWGGQGQILGPGRTLHCALAM